MSYLKTQSNKSFQRLEFYENVGKKCPGGPVIDIIRMLGTLWKSERECAGVIVLGNIILSLTLASSYFYAPYMRIKYQVMILILSMISSLAGLLAIDLMMRHNKVLPIDNVHCVN